MKYIIIIIAFLFINCQKEIKINLNSKDYKNYIQCYLIKRDDGSSNIRLTIKRVGKGNFTNFPTINNVSCNLSNIINNYNIPVIKTDDSEFIGILDTNFKTNETYTLRLNIDEDTITSNTFLPDTIKKINTLVEYVNNAQIQTFHQINDSAIENFSYVFQSTIDNYDLSEREVFEGKILKNLNFPLNRKWGCLFPYDNEESTSYTTSFYKLSAISGSIFNDYNILSGNEDEPLFIPYSLKGNINTAKSYGFFIAATGSKTQPFQLKDYSDTMFRFFIQDKNGIRKNLTTDLKINNFILDGGNTIQLNAHSDNYLYVSFNALAKILSLKTEDCSGKEFAQIQDIELQASFINLSNNKVVSAIPFTFNSASTQKDFILTLK